MDICHFDIKMPEVKPPSRDGWEQLPLGYYRMAKCYSAERRAWDKDRYSKMQGAGEMDEEDFEQDCLLSILAEVTGETVSIFELGAGWGRICLDIAGAVDFNVIQCIPKQYQCLAIEAEPTHYEWTRKHFEAQGINGYAIFGAVTNKSGSCRFPVDTRADYQYGQEIIRFTSLSKFIPSPRNTLKIISGKTLRVPAYTLDQLIGEYGFDHVDIVQMDVQGAEYDVIRGATNSIRNGMVDYFLISIHRDKYSDMLPVVLSDKYELVVNLRRMSLGVVEGFPPIRCHDGYQLYKRWKVSKG